MTQQKIRRDRNLKASVQRLQHDVEEVFQNQKFVIFLCGPSLGGEEPKSSASLRKQLLDEFEDEGFEVVLGEDDGLEELRKKYLGLAHENELKFIKSESSAVVLIADSPGSFCELGLFSYIHYEDNPRQTDFILILNEEFKRAESYLNNGPAKAISVMGGQVFHGNFSSFNTTSLLERLKLRRTIWIRQGRGGSTIGPFE